MQPFTYITARDRRGGRSRDCRRAARATRFLAGGTTLYDLMKLNVETPAPRRRYHRSAELDALRYVGERSWSSARLARMSDVAADPQLVARLSGARRVALEGGLAAAAQHGDAWAATCCSARAAPISAAASRSRATNASPGAAARRTEGIDRGHALLGGSDACIAVYPGDWAVALVAFDAKIDVLGPQGQRTIAVEELHREPGITPHIETVLEPERADPAHSCAGDAARPRVDLSQDPRPRILCLCARLGGCRAANGWRHRAGRADRDRRTRDAALARARGRAGACSAQALTPETARAAGEAALQGAKARPTTTASGSSSAHAPSPTP